MVKFDVSCMRHMSRDDFRMGMKNHELVPVELISRISKLRHGGIGRMITALHTFKLISHDRTTYDGYRLTFGGYDVLAMRALQLRGCITALGIKVGCGKESDIYTALDANGDEVLLKIHRLGRISFRTIKLKRDYMQKRSSANWLYISRLSARREFAFMKALHANGYSTPIPIDQNRHVVVMSIAKGVPMSQLRAGALRNPENIFQICIDIVTKLANQGLIHCDFNEFNILYYGGSDKDEEEVTLIDFPQMVSTSHRNAEAMFARDVNCIVRFFTVKMKWEPPKHLIPRFSELQLSDGERLDAAVCASGFQEDPSSRDIEDPDYASIDGSIDETNTNESEADSNSKDCSPGDHAIEEQHSEVEVDEPLDLELTGHKVVDRDHSSEGSCLKEESDEQICSNGGCSIDSTSDHEHSKRITSIRRNTMKEEYLKRNKGPRRQTRNQQKIKFRGKILRKGRDF